MAFKLVKLISSETIIADVYKINDLVEFIKNTPDGKSLNENLFSEEKDTILILDPVEVIMVKTAEYTETILNLYLPYSEEMIVPIDKSNIITMVSPNKKILNAYNEYMKDYKNKKETHDTLKDKDLEDDDIDDLLKSLLDLNPKKDPIN